MIGLIDPVFIAYSIALFFAILFVIAFIDSSRAIRGLQSRNCFLENILNEKCPDWRHGFSETVYPKDYK